MTIALVAARTLHFWAVATTLGGGGFLLVLQKPVRGSVAMLRTAVFVAALSGAVWLVLTLVDVTGDPTSILDVEDWGAFIGAPFGPPWAIRVVLLVAAIAVALRAHPVGYATIGALLAVDQAWLGHAAASGAPAIVGDIVHVLCAFVWVGALTMLCAVLREGDKASISAALSAFSSLGVLLVAAIVASGCFNAAFRIGRAADLVTTGYGRLLDLKFALVAVMIVLAAVNRRGGRSGRSVLGVGVLAETAIGIVVLLVAAALGVTAPPG